MFFRKKEHLQQLNLETPKPGLAPPSAATAATDSIPLSNSEAVNRRAKEILDSGRIPDWRVALSDGPGQAMSGHVAIVTGGLRGLGKAMAMGLLRTGRKVVAVGHIAEDIAPMQKEAGELAAGLHCLALDLRRPSACTEAIAAARQRFGAVDILVNNAGLTFTYTDPERSSKVPASSGN